MGVTGGRGCDVALRWRPVLPRNPDAGVVRGIVVVERRWPGRPSRPGTPSLACCGDAAGVGGVKTYACTRHEIW